MRGLEIELAPGRYSICVSRRDKCQHARSYDAWGAHELTNTYTRTHHAAACTHALGHTKADNSDKTGKTAIGHFKAHTDTQNRNAVANRKGKEKEGILSSTGPKPPEGE